MLERGMTIDTLGFAKRLEAGGFTREQAEALTEALRDASAPQEPPAAEIAFNGLADRAARRLSVVLWQRAAILIFSFLAIGWLLLSFGR